jgi:hypothetical protein
LDLRPGDIVHTSLGAGRVRGWTWLPGRGMVRVRVHLLGDRTGWHTETFSDEDPVLRWPRS